MRRSQRFLCSLQSRQEIRVADQEQQNGIGYLFIGKSAKEKSQPNTHCKKAKDR